MEKQDALAGEQYRGVASVLVFADGRDALERALDRVELAGWRALKGGTLRGAAARLADHGGVGPVYVRIEGEKMPLGLPALLERLRKDADYLGRRSVISHPFALLDLVHARAAGPLVEQLVDAGEQEESTALAWAAAPPRAAVNDPTRSEAASLLHRLSEEMGRMSAMLADLSEAQRKGRADATDESGEHAGPDVTVDAAYVRSIIRGRRLRDQYFRAELFSDPAFDMLLDLMAARLEGNRVAVSSLCIAAAVPATTALRWIKLLTDQGLFVRTADPCDGRRVYIELSDEAAGRLTEYLGAAQRTGAVAL